MYVVLGRRQAFISSGCLWTMTFGLREPFPQVLAGLLYCLASWRPKRGLLMESSIFACVWVSIRARLPSYNGLVPCSGTVKCLINRRFYISIMVKVFDNGPGELGSIPGRVISKTQNMVLDTSMLNTQHYKVMIKCKM